MRERTCRRNTSTSTSTGTTEGTNSTRILRSRSYHRYLDTAPPMERYDGFAAIEPFKVGAGNAKPASLVIAIPSPFIMRFSVFRSFPLVLTWKTTGSFCFCSWENDLPARREHVISSSRLLSASRDRLQFRSRNRYRYPYPTSGNSPELPTNESSYDTMQICYSLLVCRSFLAHTHSISTALFRNSFPFHDRCVMFRERAVISPVLVTSLASSNSARGRHWEAPRSEGTYRHFKYGVGEFWPSSVGCGRGMRCDIAPRRVSFVYFLK